MQEGFTAFAAFPASGVEGFPGVAAGENGGEGESLVPEEHGLVQHHGDGRGHAKPGAWSVEGQRFCESPGSR